MKSSRDQTLERVLRKARTPTPKPDLLDRLKNEIALPAPEAAQLTPPSAPRWRALVGRWPFQVGAIGTVAAGAIVCLILLPATEAGLDLSAVAKAMRSRAYHVHGVIRADYVDLLNGIIPANPKRLETSHPFEEYEAWVAFDEQGQLNRLRLREGARSHLVNYPLELIASDDNSDRRLILNSRPSVLVPYPAEIIERWVEGQSAGTVRLSVREVQDAANQQFVEARFTDEIVDRMWINRSAQTVDRRQLVLRIPSQGELILMDVRFDSYGGKFAKEIFDIQARSDELRRLGATPELLSQINRNTLPITLTGKRGAEFVAYLRTDGRLWEVRGKLPQTILSPAYGKTQLDVLVEANGESDPIHVWMNQFGGTMHGNGLGANIRPDGLALREPKEIAGSH